MIKHISWDRALKRCTEILEYEARAEYRYSAAFMVKWGAQKLKTPDLYRERGANNRQRCDTYFNDLLKEAQNRIMRTDIRRYQCLVSCFPKAFPKWVREGRATIALEENGWSLLELERPVYCR